MHAEDVLQDCYIRAHDCLMDRRWDGKHPHAWMRTVVTREALRQLKRRRRWQRIRAHLHRERPPPLAQEPDALPASMRAHLDALPPLQRVAILLVSLEDASTQDIAQALGKSQGAIEQLLVRARRTLRQRLDS
jgi:RNA polymerase sigma-70 factor (ECF subfamily)